ncbi:MAG: S9 family peptidase [Planctomycetes bacterium]|nr:S9 family peptidase [Planctomycetota bacterium]
MDTNKLPSRDELRVGDSVTCRGDAERETLPCWRFGLGLVIAALGLSSWLGCRPVAEPAGQGVSAAPADAAADGTAALLKSGGREGVLGPAILPRAPKALRERRVVTVHGQELADDYFWLQDRDDKRVMHYLDAENRYADAVLQHTEELQKKLYDEFIARTKQSDQTVPQRWGDFFYYTRWEKDQQYNVHCRRKGKLDAPEQVILDENTLAKEGDYFAMGPTELSPDQRWLAYGTDATGNEQYTLRIKDLEKNDLLADSVPNAGEAVAWANDNRTLFYTTRDESARPYRLYRHVVGTDPKQDVLVYEEPDKAFFLSVAWTRSRKFLLLELTSNASSEIRFLDASQPTGEFKLVEPRRPGVEYGVRHQGDTFWVITNDGAKNFRLMETAVATPGREHWREVIPNRDDVKLDGAEVFANHLVLLERQGGVPTMRVRDLKTGAIHPVEFQEPAYTLSLEDNPEFNTQQIRFSYSSLLSPPSVFEYDLVTHERKLLKRDEVAGFDPAHYQTERIEATAADGTKVPISLVYRRGLKRDGSNPVLLCGYGAYGLSEDPTFDAARLSLLDRGFIYATAHVRGGGDLGRAWYESGKLKHKENTFSDFIACAEHLIREKYTSPRRLAISGASAGGMLVGVVANRRPELFHVVVADVPFVDVLNTMLDPKMPLTVTEFDEWGNPQDREAFERIRSYSPYDNVRKQNYPHMLVRGSLNDTRVSYWEPAKWVAKLRANKTGDQLLLLKIDLEAGHNGASGRYDYLDSQATEYAFILDCMGIGE